MPRHDKKTQKVPESAAFCTGTMWRKWNSAADRVPKLILAEQSSTRSWNSTKIEDQKEKAAACAKKALRRVVLGFTQCANEDGVKEVCFKNVFLRGKRIVRSGNRHEPQPSENLLSSATRHPRPPSHG